MATGSLALGPGGLVEGNSRGGWGESGGEGLSLVSRLGVDRFSIILIVR